MPPSEPSPVCIVTFVTRTGRCCYYATTCRQGPDGEWGSLKMPEQVTAQLDALGARVAWMWIGPPHALRIKGEAVTDCEAVTAAAPAEMGRLVFL
jgi:hypothetical protein